MTHLWPIRCKRKSAGKALRKLLFSCVVPDSWLCVSVCWPSLQSAEEAKAGEGPGCLQNRSWAGMERMAMCLVYTHVSFASPCAWHIVGMHLIFTD